MEIQDTFINGLKVIHLNKFTDERGSFIKVFNEEFFLSHDLEVNFKESYYTISKKGVIRGMHFQVPPAEHTKLVYVNHGVIHDVVLDIRIKSSSFGLFYDIVIDAENSPKLLYIPVGCAHGFKSLKEGTVVTYMQTSCYNKESDRGIRFDSFGFDWKTDFPIISNRDLSFASFEQIITPF